MFAKIGVPQNGWFIMENHIEMDDLGVPPFSETPILKLTILGIYDQHFTQFSVTIAGHRGITWPWMKCNCVSQAPSGSTLIDLFPSHVQVVPPRKAIRVSNFTWMCIYVQLPFLLALSTIWIFVHHWDSPFNRELFLSQFQTVSLQNRQLGTWMKRQRQPKRYNPRWKHPTKTTRVCTGTWRT